MSENAPVCDSVEGTLESVLPEQIFDFINLHGADNAPKDATGLCAHTLYGGKDKDNLGAICLKQDDSSTRTLSINSIRKAPQYTTDYYQTGLHPTLAVQLLEIFCFAACHCPGDEEMCASNDSTLGMRGLCRPKLLAPMIIKVSSSADVICELTFKCSKLTSQ